MSLSELFEKWSEHWVKSQQERFKPTVEKLIREKLKLDEEYQIVWNDSEFEMKGEEKE